MSRRWRSAEWLALAVLAVAMWFLPKVVDDPARIRQWAEYLSYGALAVGVDLAWGYGGMLVLGQGVFFGLGAYCMGMYLSLENVPKGSKLPSFMSLYGNFEHLPLMWQPFHHLWFAIAAAAIVPAVLAILIGMLVFTRRIRGPFFALITQATALVFTLVLIGNLPYTAGTNGLTSFTKIFGRNKYTPGTSTWLYELTVVVLAAMVAIGLVVVRSRFGRLLVATRDSEDRVRFLGYDPMAVKTATFAIGAAISGIAGAIAAPVIGIVAPNQFGVLPSILMVCWVAVGGRGTLWGAVLGAIAVNFAKTRVSEARPDDWQYVQGALFIAVLAFAPGGLVALLRSAGERIRAIVPRARPARAPVPQPTEAVP